MRHGDKPFLCCTIDVILMRSFFITLTSSKILLSFWHSWIMWSTIRRKQSGRLFSFLAYWYLVFHIRCTFIVKKDIYRNKKWKKCIVNKFSDVYHLREKRLKHFLYDFNESKIDDDECEVLGYFLLQFILEIIFGTNGK